MTNYLEEFVNLNVAKLVDFYGINLPVEYVINDKWHMLPLPDDGVIPEGYYLCPTYYDVLCWINGLTAEQSVGLQRLDSPTSWAIITEKSGRKSSEYFHGSLEGAFDVILFKVFFENIEQYFPSAIDGGYKRVVARGQQKILHEIEILTRPSWLRIDACVDDSIIYNITEEQARALRLLRKQGKLYRLAFCEWPTADEEEFWHIITVDDFGNLSEMFHTNFLSINDNLTSKLLLD